MTNEEYQNILKRIDDLESKAIQVNLSPTDQENIKNAVFEGYAYSTFDGTPSLVFLKVVWKNKIIYLPYYTDV